MSETMSGNTFECNPEVFCETVPETSENVIMENVSKSFIEF